MKPRVRIAPSPTGPLHIGTARTALFNYLFAKKSGGSFILRIEDTDLERSDKKWEKDIIDGLKWLGIKWDEKIYRQSERLETYANYLDKLLKEGKAYYCFCSEDDLEAKRQHQISVGITPIYNGQCRNLSQNETKKDLAEGKPAIIRFNTPEKKVRFKDIVRGFVEFDSALIGDFSIAKDLAAPLYNFAVVIDDFEMEITHVIRGEDHISNTPKQILLQEALNFPMPEYAHLSLILGSDRSKLSKRHGATSIREYREQGYLPEALVNFMALLGWNPGTEKEIFSIKELVKEFSLEKVQKSGAVFDTRRLDYLNGFYIRKKTLNNLAKLCLPYLKEQGFMVEKYNLSQLKEIVYLYQDRLKKLSELPELVDFFFKDRLEYNKELLRWSARGGSASGGKDMTDEEVKESLDKLEEILSKIKPSDFKKEELEKKLMPEAEKMGDRGYLLWPLRVALTGKQASAGPFEIAEILGKKEVLKRIKNVPL